MKKTDRIKRNTIIGEVHEGWIGLVDIKSKFTALKAVWIPRLLSINHFFTVSVSLQKFISNILWIQLRRLPITMVWLITFKSYTSKLFYAIINAMTIAKSNYLHFHRFFYYNIFVQIKILFSKKRKSALNIRLEAEFYV